jgi:hypothetical protein
MHCCLRTVVRIGQELLPGFRVSPIKKYMQYKVYLENFPVLFSYTSCWAPV